MIKDETAFEKYMKIWGKVSKIINKLIVNLQKNNSAQKKDFNVLYTSILIGLVYRKDENYHPKVFLEKF